MSLLSFILSIQPRKPDVVGGGLTVVPDDTAYLIGETITVAVTGGPGAAANAVGLYLLGDDPAVDLPVDWKYLENDSQTPPGTGAVNDVVTFSTTGLTPGSYVAHLLDVGFNEPSEIFEVAGGPAGTFFADTASATRDITHTFEHDANLCVVLISFEEAMTVNSVTIDPAGAAIAMTQLGTTVVNSFSSAAVFYAHGLNLSGVKTIRVITSSTNYLTVEATSFRGAENAAPSPTGIASVTGTSASILLTGVNPDGHLILIANVNANPTITPTGGITINRNDNSTVDGWRGVTASKAPPLSASETPGLSLSASQRIAARAFVVNPGVELGPLAPVVSIGLENKNATVGSSFSYQFDSDSFTDPNGDVLTYSATLAGGGALPGWLTFTPSTRTFSAASPVLGLITVRVTATDPGSLSVFDDFTIDVASVPDIALYETFELSVTNSNSFSNKFNFTVVTVQAIFTAPSNDTYTVFGFHDGGTTWKIRFPPVEEGTWSYTTSWPIGADGQTPSGSFQVGPRTNAGLHGPLATDGARYLRNHDGTPHFEIASNRVNNQSWPQTKNGFTNSLYVSNAAAATDMDQMVASGVNSYQQLLSYFPLENDGYTWDTIWAARIDSWIEMAQARGLYYLIGTMNTWGHDITGGPFTWVEVEAGGSEDDFPFNAWSGTTTDRNKAINYLKYAIARWGGYSNVHFELNNEFGHPSHTSTQITTFANDAEDIYLPLMAEYDPFNRPVTLSETYVNGVGILGVHQLREETNGIPLPSVNRRWYFNELVRDDADSDSAAVTDLYAEARLKNAAYRDNYRKAHWRAFAWGGVGSFICTERQLNDLPTATLNVLNDAGRLMSFIDDLAALGIDINDGTPVDGSIITGGAGTNSGWARRRERRLVGQWYVTYIELGTTPSAGAGNFPLSLPAGSYEARLYHPSSSISPAYSTPVSISGGTPTVAHPGFSRDIVLFVRAV